MHKGQNAHTACRQAYPSIETVQLILGYVHLCPLLSLLLVAVDAGQKRCEDANLKVKGLELGI